MKSGRLDSFTLNVGCERQFWGSLVISYHHNEFPEETYNRISVLVFSLFKKVFGNEFRLIFTLSPSCRIFPDKFLATILGHEPTSAIMGYRGAEISRIAKELFEILGEDNGSVINTKRFFRVECIGALQIESSL